jgi:hypothetical protein
MEQGRVGCGGIQKPEIMELHWHPKKRFFEPTFTKEHKNNRYKYETRGKIRHK